MTTDLLAALPALLAIGAGVGLVALFRDPPAASEHDLSDYLPTPVNDPAPRRYRSADRQPADILPPAPAGMNAGSPLYAATLVDQWLREWGGSADEIAGRFLRELGDEAKTQSRELVRTR